MAMTATCWWAYTYRREGFIPQMYGSIRACCAATSELDMFPRAGIQWGDRKLLYIFHFRESFADQHIVGTGEKFRHAGFSSSKVEQIVPGELYAGHGAPKEKCA